MAIGIHQVYLFLAIAGSVFFLIQFAMTLLGIGAETDVEVVDGSTLEVEANDAGDIGGFSFLSIKTITSFITFFGWGGVFWGGLGAIGFAIAMGCGFVMMFITALILHLLLKLQESGNIAIGSFVGHTGVVYLTIPGNRENTGTVTINLPGCTRQVKALADEKIERGVPIRVKEALADELLLVEKI